MKHRLFTFIGLLIALSFAFAHWGTDVTQAGIYNASSETTYKEYWLSHNLFTAGCGESEVPGGGSWYIEPWPCTKTVNFEIPDDFSQALKVEIYLNLWRNHTGRSAAFRINDGPDHFSNVGYDWSRTPYIAEIPKAELRQGVNTITFWNEAGGYQIHDIAFRIYYDLAHPLIAGAGSDVTPPTGRLTSIVAANGAFLPSAGGTLNVDDNQVTLNAVATDAAYVEFHAFYYGYDEDNDGVFLEWHNRNRFNYNPGGTDPQPQGGTIDHIGTDTNPPYSATWNLAQVPNQSDVKFKLRIVDAAGNVREAAGGVSADFTLARSYSVKAYLIPGFQDAVLHHGGTEPDSVTRYIDLPADLSDIAAAYLIGSYWQNPYIAINDNPQFLAFSSGEDVWHSSVREINVAQLRGGQNKLVYIYNPDQISFGQFIEQPGPMIVLRQQAPSPAVFRLTRNNVEFKGVEGGPQPRPQWLGVVNTGSGALHWSVSAIGSPTWLTVTPLSGADDGDVQLGVNTTGLVSGTLTGTLRVTALETTRVQTVNVTLSVTSTVTPLYQQDFQTYISGTHPAHWLDTGAYNSLTANNGLFRVAQLGGGYVLSTASALDSIHSHYVFTGSETFSSYEYTGRMRVSSAGSGIGVTFLSQYPRADAYYGLRRAANGSFQISPHATSVSGGQTDTGVTPSLNTWYLFKIRVEDVGTRTEIRARVWAEGSAEPAAWQADCYDASSLRLAAGTIGVWSQGDGIKYWDDVLVTALPLEADRTPPRVYRHNPAPQALSVSPSSNIVVHVGDSDTGVAVSSLAMTVRGVAVAPSVTGTPADYTLTYDPPSNFSEGETVTVTVDACDLAGPANCAPTQVYSFAVRTLPTIDIWYGSHQVFGQMGIPQPWVNVLGRVSDPDGVISLTYSLNGGPAFPLSIGKDDRRLAGAGDFNVEMAYASLTSGVNQVVITATDSLNDRTARAMTVEYRGGHTWPRTYSIDWSATSAISNVAQIVDGLWNLEADSIRPAILGYDRMVTLGDMSWDDYEVTVPITIHAIDPAGYAPPNGGPGVGLLLRWPGHYDWGGRQPTIGWHPLGALGWYRWQDDSLGDRLMMLGGNNGNLLAEDTSGRKLALGVRYNFKLRVETTPGQGGFYRLKVWEASQPEPSNWDLYAQETLADPQRGSLALLAHHVDASFGDISITPGPFTDTTSPTLSNIQVTRRSTFATITWNTDEPATSQVNYGLTAAYETGSVSSSDLVVQHAITLTGLTANTVYHYQVSSADASGNPAQSGDSTFKTTLGVPSIIASDDFNTCGFNNELWTFIDPYQGNPSGQATLVLTGTHTPNARVMISIPAGLSHDVWSGGNMAPRIMQPANDTDFELEAKFESGLNAMYQIQGILVEQDSNNLLRFDFHSDNTNTFILAASIANNVPTTRINSVIAGTNVAPLYMRVNRESDQWTLSYSYDRIAWTTAGSFAHTFIARAVGVFAGNSGSNPPAHTGSIDYFFNTESPIVAEDGDRNTLQVSALGNGTVGRTPDLPVYSCGQVVTLTAQPVSGWSFQNWSGDLSGASTPVTLTMTRSRSVMATFTWGAGSAWWNQAWHFRLPIEVKPNGYERYERPVEADLNFTQFLTSLGKAGTLDTNSIRVIEVNAQGAVIDDAVDLQFDPADDYDAATNARGTLVFLLKGITVANATRYFHVYFDTVNHGPFVPLSVTRQITVTDDIAHEGQTSFRIQTAEATYYYHKLGAGFASMEDRQGIDWLGYHPGGGSAGEYRGLPNMGDVAHPGYTNSSSTLVRQGPLKAKILSESTDKLWALTWEMYPRYAKMTLIKRNPSANYWFLYEGIPNGQLDVNQDYVVRSTGVKNYANQSWAGDIPEPEWAYFGDDNVSRVLFVAHHEDDTAPDQFYQMEGNMTVFGFGRLDPCCDRYLTLVPAHFTIGFAESSAAAPQVINSAYRDLVFTLGQPELLNRAPVLDAIGDKAVQAGTLLTFTVSASDPDGDTPTLSAKDLPAGANFITATGVFSWTPTLPAHLGAYTTTFIASDGVLSDTETIIIAVNAWRAYLPLIVRGQ